jgi:hypothetical protein
MANVQSIRVNVQTGTDPDSDADGAIYIGFCGCEFPIDSSGEDFEKGASKTYVFGRGANVSNANRNDPRNPQLQTENIDKYPVYIRMGTTDHWQLRRVTVSINDALVPMYDTADVLGVSGRFWLGSYCRANLLYPHARCLIPADL